MTKYLQSIPNLLGIYICFPRIPGLLVVSLLIASQMQAQHYYPGGLGNTNLLLWLDANKGSSITQNGSNQVSEWADLSGNGYNFQQTVAANEPVFNATGGPNNKPALTFNASSDQYLFSQANLPAFSLTAGISAFAMASFNAPLTGQGWQRIYDFGNGTASDNFMMGRRAATASMYYEGWKGGAGDQTWTTTNPITNGYSTVYDFVQSAGAAGTLSAVTGNVAGAVQAMSGAAGANTWVPASIVRTKNYIGHSNWAADEYFGGTMSEILIYNTAFNTTERIIAENYLAQEWGQPITNSEYTAPAANTYTTNLVGIGYTSAADNFLTDIAGSTDGLGFSSSSGATGFLNTAGYLSAAHNGQSNTVITNASIPGITSANPLSRWNRSWQVQKTGGNAAGQVTFNFNFSDYNGTAPGGALTYALLYNATDGTFATGTNQLIATVTTTVAGNIVSFLANSSNIAKGYYSIIYSASPISLPIVLTDFQAIAETGAALLQWTVSAGSDPASFDIQRSSDAVQFASIGSLSGGADSSTPGQYSFTDHQPVAGANYYRLKMTDIAGNLFYSGIRSVNFNGGTATGLRLYPNPATDQLTISMPGITGTVELRIINAAGSVIRTGQFSSTGLLQIPIWGLAKGVYFLEVRHGPEKYIQGFLKN
jgi:Secretion system C-terminal sorting domain